MIFSLKYDLWKLNLSYFFSNLFFITPLKIKVLVNASRKLNQLKNDNANVLFFLENLSYSVFLQNTTMFYAPVFRINCGFFQTTPITCTFTFFLGSYFVKKKNNLKVDLFTRPTKSVTVLIR